MAMADHCPELCLLPSGGIVCGCVPAGRNADDSENLCLCVDGSHRISGDAGVGDSRKIIILGNCETGSQSRMKMRIESCNAGFLR